MKNTAQITTLFALGNLWMARKAARKEARAKKNAELKKLESAGYKPGGYDPNYPESAQKKAAGQ